MEPPNLPDKIAIVGVALRLPGGTCDLSTFWQRLREGRNLAADVPAQRWSAAWHAEGGARAGHTLTHKAALLEDIDQFDPEYFQIPEDEARVVDPQHRLLLELAVEALDDAGWPEDKIRGGNLGVFVGLSGTDYLSLHAHDATLPGPHFHNVKHYMAPNRLSYYLDARGPSIAVDGACATSMLAVHLACASLRRGECDAALVGSANVMLNPAISVSFSQLGTLAEDGRCKPFDEAANGYGRADGAAMLLLRRIDDARADGDRVHALIRASGSSHGGRNPLGFAAPRHSQQAELIRRVLDSARLAPEEIDYLEAHGTGTLVGDREEALALGEVFKSRQAAALPIGSVKACYNHSETSAGITGILKAVAIVKRRELPPTALVSEPRAEIDFGALGLRLVAGPELLEVARPLRVGVNSFGVGGSYAHVIVEENAADDRAAAVLPSRAQRAARARLVPLCDKRDGALQATIGRYREHVEAHADELSIDDIAYTLSQRRTHHACRSFVVADDATRLARELARAPTAERPPPTTPPLIFVFTGMGPQWWAMGRELLRDEPVFDEALQAFDALWSGRAEWSLLEQMALPEERCLVGDDVTYSMVVNVALQVALARLWAHWGVEPDAIVGHSLGELAAAHVAGLLTLEQLVALTHARAGWTAQVDGLGGMAAVALSADSLAPYLRDVAPELDIAAENAPRSVAVSGEMAALERLTAALEADGVWCRVLRVSVPFHSRHLRARRDQLALPQLGDLADVPTIPLWSTVSGERHERGALDGAYWLRNFCEPVQFRRALEGAIGSRVPTLLEIGPHAVLRGAIEEIVAQDHPDARGFSLHSLERKAPERETALTSAGRLFQRGHALDWRALLDGRGQLVDLPPKRWQRRRLWSESLESRSMRLRATTHALLGEATQPASARETTVWRSSISARSQPFLLDHQLSGDVVFPGACFVEMLRAAAASALQSDSVALTDVTFERALFVDERERSHLRTVVNALERRIEIFSASAPAGEPWVRHASCGYGEVSADQAVARGQEIARASAQAMREHCESLDVAARYEARRQRGLRLAGGFQVMASLQRGPAGATTQISAATRQLDAFLARALAVEAAFQTSSADDDARYATTLALPHCITRLSFVGDAATAERVHARQREGRFRVISADAAVLDGADNTVLLLEGFERRTVDEPGGLSWRPEDAILCEQLVPSPTADDGALPSAVCVLCESGGASLSSAAGITAEESPSDAVARRLVEQLRAREQTSLGAGYVCVDKQERLESWLAVRAERAKRAAIVDLRALDDAWQLDSVEAGAYGERCWRALELIRALGERTLGGKPAPRVVFVARARSASAHGLVALERVACSEYPALDVCVVQLDAAPADASARLLDELATRESSSPAEREISWRDDERLALRVERAGGAQLLSSSLARHQVARAAAAGTHVFSIEAQRNAHGGERLCWAAQRRPTLAPHEVRIDVRWVSLNFRDVLKSMGLYPADERDPDAVGLGDECVGVVREVGSASQELSVGQTVVVRASGRCLATEVCVPAAQAFCKPASLDDAQAACLPVVFTTAWYALRTLGQLAAGERVLIHSGAGGVGLAAIQIAKLCGAEVFVTAGTEEKRELLRAMGVRAALDSKTPSFADAIMELTDGEGIDMVLNSVVGVAMTKSLALLRHFGRFLEIGKRDLFDNTPIGLYALRNNISYHSVDLAKLWRMRPRVARSTFDAVLNAFAEGELEPLPLQRFEAVQLIDAFDAMSDRARVGKVAVHMADPSESRLPLHDKEAYGYRCDIDAESVYLVSGGLGALGLEVLRWLADAGARHVVVLSRSGVSTDSQRDALAALERRDVKVQTFAGSVGDVSFVQSVVARITADGRRLRGVLHLAGVLRDAPMRAITRADFDAVLAPKVAGALALHQACASLPLDFFVLFSSASVMAGSGGQASYCAANALLDWLARERRDKALPAQSLGWGPFIGGGMMADSLVAARLAQGVTGFTGAEVRELLDSLLPRHQPHVFLRRGDWRKYLGNMTSVPRRFALLQSVTESSGSDALLDTLRQASDEERVALLEDYLCGVIGKMTGQPREALASDLALGDIGVDSLTVMNLSNRIAYDLSVRVPPGDLTARRSLGSLAHSLASRVGGAAAGTSKQHDDSRDDDGNASASNAPASEQLCPTLPGQLLFIQAAARDARTLHHPMQSVPLVFQCTERLTPEQVEWVLAKLCGRHEALRARLLRDESGRWRQWIRPRQTPSVRTIEIEDGDAAFDEALTQLCLAPWEIASEPLLRCALVEQPQSGQALIVSICHVAADQVSAWTLSREIVELCDAARGDLKPRLPPVATPFSVWARHIASVSDEVREEDYPDLQPAFARGNLKLGRPTTWVRTTRPTQRSNAAVVEILCDALANIEELAVLVMGDMARPADTRDLAHTVGCLAARITIPLEPRPLAGRRDWSRAIATNDLKRTIAQQRAVSRLTRELRDTLDSRMGVINVWDLRGLYRESSATQAWDTERVRGAMLRAMRRFPPPPAAVVLHAIMRYEYVKLSLLSRLPGFGEEQADRLFSQIWGAIADS